jgi:hypothetical protein
VNGWEAFWIGIAPEHRLALVAVALLPVGWRLLRRRRPAPAGVPLTDRWAAILLAIAAVAHLALPLGHADSALMTVGFLGSGAAYAALALRAREGRSWRLPSTGLIVATLVAYLWVTTAGGEEADQVGIATALVELVALGMAAVPQRDARLRRWAGSTATVAAVMVFGATVWIAALVGHEAADAAPTASAAAAGHDHHHGHAARAQAGVVMRPMVEHHPTPAQAAAAAQLAERTRRAVRRYADLDAAIADGYRGPVAQGGTDVHLEQEKYGSDGRTLDPDRPEMLVYAVEGGRATLLGAVFQMERAGAAGPDPGGPITDWHAHNICLSALPPGFGLVSPYGGCPALSVAMTAAEMMHVWTVDSPPGGPFAESLDERWIRAYHATHGRPYTAH